MGFPRCLENRGKPTEQKKELRRVSIERTGRSRGTALESSSPARHSPAFRMGDHP